MRIISLKNIQEVPTSHAGVGRKKVMVANGQVPHIRQFSQVRFQPGEVVQEHMHETLYEVFLIESGKGIMKIDDIEYPLERGTCVTVEPGERHEVRNAGEDELIMTFFGLESKE